MALVIVVIVLLVVAAGIALAAAATRSSARWRALVRDLVPGNQLDGRGLTWSIDARVLRVSTPLAPAGTSYQSAARALGRGTLLALLDRLQARASDRELEAQIALSGIGAATLLAQLESFVALAAALEAMPVAEAMARAFVELPPDTASAERLAAFEALVRWYPRAADVLGVCRGEARGGEDPAIAAAARAHLASVISKPHGHGVPA